ncbi:MAG: hypothetical protein ACE5GK_09805 [Nitrospiria bacterium]
MKLKHLLYIWTLFVTTACAEEPNRLEQKSDAANPVQEKMDQFLQPRIHALEKFKGLENHIKEAEEKRQKK